MFPIPVSRALAWFLVVIACSVGSIRDASAQIVALGASNVEGYGVSSSEAFPAQLEAMLRAKGRPYSVSNQGVYGDTTAGVLGRLDSAVPSGTQIVVLAIGGNDVRRGSTVAEARAGVQAIVSRLSARRIRVINAMPFVLGALRSGMRQSDGIHLSPEGHRAVAAKVASMIR